MKLEHCLKSIKFVWTYKLYTIIIVMIPCIFFHYIFKGK